MNIEKLESLPFVEQWSKVKNQEHEWSDFYLYKSVKAKKHKKIFEKIVAENVGKSRETLIGQIEGYIANLPKGKERDFVKKLKRILMPITGDFIWLAVTYQWNKKTNLLEECESVSPCVEVEVPRVLVVETKMKKFKQLFKEEMLLVEIEDKLKLLNKEDILRFISLYTRLTRFYIAYRKNVLVENNGKRVGVLKFNNKTETTVFFADLKVNKAKNTNKQYKNKV